MRLPMTIKHLKRFKLVETILITLSILFLIGLSLYGLKGFYSRYAQDDYCYGYRVNTFGFWQTQVSSYLYPTEFNSNRYALTFLQSVAEILGGSSFVPVLVELSILTWAVCLGYLFYQLTQTRVSFLSVSSAILFAGGILFFTLYLAGNLYQILFWLSGMLTYLTPMILSTLILGRIVFYAKNQPLKKVQFLEIPLLCLIAGGFSETTTLWLLAVLGLVFFGLLLSRNKSDLVKNAIKVMIPAIAATTIALIILIVCPANYYRAQVGNFERPDWPTFIRMILFFGEEYIRVTIKSAPLPYLSLAVLGFWLAGLIESPKFMKPKAYLGAIVIGLAALYLLSVTTMVPTMYAMSSYPGDRALLPIHFSLILFTFSCGWFLARFVQTQFPAIWRAKIYLPVCWWWLLLIGMPCAVQIQWNAGGVQERGCMRHE